MLKASEPWGVWMVRVRESESGVSGVPYGSELRTGKTKATLLLQVGYLIIQDLAPGQVPHGKCS